MALKGVVFEFSCHDPKFEFLPDFIQILQIWYHFEALDALSPKNDKFKRFDLFKKNYWSQNAKNGRKLR